LYHAGLFPRERRFHTDFPTDTFLLYQKTFADIISSPDHIVLVAEDIFNPREGEGQDAKIVPDAPIELPEPGERVVVGVVAWKLPKGSPRSGQFLQADKIPAELRIEDGPGRDRDWTISKEAQKALVRCRATNFPSDSYQELTIMVVHPAYWARGHGSRLVEWGLALADLDGMKQGVMSGSASGIKLYLRLGVEQVDEFLLLDEGTSPPENFKVCAFTYTPSSLRERIVASHS
jgi:N-acetylglutamate synthase-like GNAT family acetyltransferase